MQYKESIKVSSVHNKVTKNIVTVIMLTKKANINILSQ